MKINKFLFNMLITLCLFGNASPEGIDASKAVTPIETTKATPASWTFLVYIAADNSLADYAAYNMNDMSAGLASLNGVNVLVQWDKPADNKAWRYKITPGGKIDAGTFSSEMGYNPATELVNSMQWAITNYPAKKYALVLWDHGSGIEDFYPATARTIINNAMHPSLPDRGILYDDSQGTCLTNPGLTNALGIIKKMLGKKLDLIAMDACLMAMVEVGYQMKDLVNIFVGSQETIPGEGYPYSQFLRPLSLNPATTSPLILAKNMVTAYSKFYTQQMPTSDFTLSAIDVTSINLIKQNIDQFITAVAACKKINAASTKSIILAARKASISFAMPEYIDLYSFYANVLNQIKKISPKSLLILEKRHKTIKAVPSKAFKKTLDALSVVVLNGLNKITKIVLTKAAGPVYSGTKGISIYYPSDGNIDSSYPQTLFAQNTAWMQFIQTYH